MKLRKDGEAQEDGGVQEMVEFKKTVEFRKAWNSGRLWSSGWRSVQEDDEVQGRSGAWEFSVA